MRPAFKITVNGSNITQLVADRLVSLSITDEAGVKSDRLELVLDDRDQRLEIPPTKAEISVEIGYQTIMVPKGVYTVEEVELEGPLRRMTIRANATGASKGAGAAKERSWDDTTLGKIARSIASKHGWTPAISSELEGVKIDHVDQSENDLQFLTRLASENGAVVKVAHKRLVLSPQAEGKTTSGKTLPKINVDGSQVTEWTLTLAERGNYAGVKAEYHDVKTGQRGEEINGEDTENTTVIPYTYPTKEAAKRAAKSRHDSHKRGKITFTISSMPGNPFIEAESILQASGFRTGVDGEWLVNSARHQLNDSGYTCSVQCEIPDSDKKKDEE